MVKFKPFYNKLENLKTKKITIFKLLRLHLQNKIILEIFIPTISQHSHPYREFYCSVWTRNGSCSSYCNECYVLEVFLIFLLFEQGVRTTWIRRW